MRSTQPHDDPPAERSVRTDLLLILWPAFVMAGVLEMLVFSLVDPGSLHGFGDEPLDWSRSAVYSVAFFIFWGVITISGLITRFLQVPVSKDP